MPRRGQALQVVQRDRGGDHGVQDAFGDLRAVVAPQHGRVRHQVADIAHEHQRAAVQRHVLAARAGVLAVGVEAAREGLAALVDLLRSACPSGCPASCGRPAPCRRRRPRPPSLPGRGWSTAPTPAPGRSRRRRRCAPMGWLRSMRMSMCRPLCDSSTADGAPQLALEADELRRVRQARPCCRPSASPRAAPSTTR